MKRFYALSSLLLLTGILLSSCGITIERRQHTKGYYIHTNARQQSAAPHTKTAEATAPTETGAVATAQNVQSGIRAAEEPAVMPAEKAAVYKAHGAVEAHGTVAEARQTTAERRPIGIRNNTPATELKEQKTWKEKANTGLEKMKSSSARADSAGLSLFWIVILVLLVLWALGLIGGWGTGGLIYILLVVALILLILWLLRIV